MAYDYEKELKKAQREALNKYAVQLNTANVEKRSEAQKKALQGTRESERYLQNMGLAGRGAGAFEGGTVESGAQQEARNEQIREVQKVNNELRRKEEEQVHAAGVQMSKDNIRARAAAARARAEAAAAAAAQSEADAKQNAENMKKYGSEKGVTGKSLTNVQVKEARDDIASRRARDAALDSALMAFGSAAGTGAAGAMASKITEGVGQVKSLEEKKAEAAGIVFDDMGAIKAAYRTGDVEKVEEAKRKYEENATIKKCGATVEACENDVVISQDYMISLRAMRDAAEDEELKAYVNYPGMGGALKYSGGYEMVHDPAAVTDEDIYRAFEALYAAGATDETIKDTAQYMIDNSSVLAQSQMLQGFAFGDLEGYARTRLATAQQVREQAKVEANVYSAYEKVEEANAAYEGVKAFGTEEQKTAAAKKSVEAQIEMSTGITRESLEKKYSDEAAMMERIKDDAGKTAVSRQEYSKVLNEMLESGNYTMEKPEDVDRFIADAAGKYRVNGLIGGGYKGSIAMAADMAGLVEGNSAQVNLRVLDWKNGEIGVQSKKDLDTYNEKVEIAAEEYMITQRDDFAEKSTYSEEYAKRFPDEYGSNFGKAKYAAEAGDAYLSEQRNKYGYMTETEREIYNVLFDEDVKSGAIAEGRTSIYTGRGESKSKEYLDKIGGTLYARMTTANSTEMEAFAKGIGDISGEEGAGKFRSGLMATVASFALKPLDTMTNMGTIAGGLLNGNQLNELGYSHMADTIRSGVSEEINGAFWKKTYELGTNAVDNILSNTLAVISPAIPMVTMGMDAATATMASMAESGLTNGQIVSIGVAAGIFESFFEKYSIEAFLDADGQFMRGEMIKALASTFSSNMEEEAATELANILAESLIAGDKSSYAQKVREYIGKGYSIKDANVMAAGDCGEQILGAGIEGGLSAFMMIGMEGVINFKTTSSIRSMGSMADMSKVLDACMKSGDTELVQNARHFMEIGVDKMTNKQKGEMLLSYIRMTQEDMADIVDDLVKGRKKDDLKDIFGQIIMGNAVSEDMAEKIAKTNGGLDAFNKVFGRQATEQTIWSDVQKAASKQSLMISGTAAKVRTSPERTNSDSERNAKKVKEEDAAEVMPVAKTDNTKEETMEWSATHGTAGVAMPATKTAAQEAEEEARDLKTGISFTLDNTEIQSVRMADMDGTDEEKRRAWEKTIKPKKRMQLQILNNVTSAFGMKVVVHETLASNGFVKDGKIHIAMDAENGMVWAFCHESVHWIQQQAEKLGTDTYDRLKNYIIENVGTEKFETRVSEQMDKWGYDRTQAEDEVIARELEGIMESEANIRKLAETDTRVATTIRDHLEDWVANIKKTIEAAGRVGINYGREDLRDAEGALERWAKAIEDINEMNGNNRAAERTNTAMAEDYARTQRAKAEETQRELQTAAELKQLDTTGEENDKNGNQAAERNESGSIVQLQIREDTEGRKYVKAVGNVFKSNDKERRAIELENVLRKLIGETGRIDIPTSDGKVISITDSSYNKGYNSVGKLTSFEELRNERGAYDEKAIALKQNVAFHIKEVVEVSRDTGKTREDNKQHSHGAFAERGWNYREFYFENNDGKLYRCMMSIANNRSGETVYNVSGFRERSGANSFPGSSLSGAQVSDSTNSIKANNNVFVKNSIQTSVRETLRQNYDAVQQMTEEDLGELYNIGKINIGMWYLKDISRVMDAVGKNNPKVRQMLHRVIEAPAQKAVGNYARQYKTRVESFRKKLEELGVYNKKDSRLIQVYGEGHYQAATDVNVKRIDADTFAVKAVTENGYFGRREECEATMTRDQLDRAFTDGQTRNWIKIMDNLEDRAEREEWSAEYRQKIAQEGFNFHSYVMPFGDEDLDRACRNRKDDVTTDTIKEAVNVIRDMYDGYIKEINGMMDEIYPYVLEADEDRIEKIETKISQQDQFIGVERARTETLRKQIEVLQDLQSKREGKGGSGTATKAYVNTAKTIIRKQQRLADSMRTIQLHEMQKEELRMKADAIRSDEELRKEGKLPPVRRHRLEYRKDYFHHFSEAKKGDMLSEVISAWMDDGTKGDPELVGKTDTTKPKSKWLNFMQRREGGSYAEDAINGMLRYMKEAEYQLAFDPVIATSQELIKQMRDEGGRRMDGDSDLRKTADTVNDFIYWMEEWVNGLAGKRDAIERAITDRMGTFRRISNVLNVINGHIIRNTLYFNARSSIVQISNITNAVMYVRNVQDWMQGARYFAESQKEGSEAHRIMNDESNFLFRRLNEPGEQLTEGKMAKAEEFAGYMLSAFDNLSSQLTWWAAYSEYERRGDDAGGRSKMREYDNAVDYADDITRRSHGGRGEGEMAPIMKNKIVSFFAPFQVEVNNTYLALKEQIGKKNALGIVETEAAVFMLNTMFQALFGDTPLGFDFIRAMMEIIYYAATGGDDDDNEVKDIMEYSLQRIVGEFASGIPFAAQVVSMLPEDLRTMFIGTEQDPTRYGTSNIGIGGASKMFMTAVDAINGKFDWQNAVNNTLPALLPIGGKQAARTIVGVSTVMQGYGSKYGNDGEQIQFAVEGNLIKGLQAGVFGKWSISEAQQYLNGETPAPWMLVTPEEYRGIYGSTLSAEDTETYKEATKEKGISGKDFFRIRADIKAEKGQTAKREAIMNDDKLTPEQKAWIDMKMVESTTGRELYTLEGCVFAYLLDDEGNKKVSSDGLTYETKCLADFNDDERFTYSQERKNYKDARKAEYVYGVSLEEYFRLKDIGDENGADALRDEIMQMEDLEEDEKAMFEELITGKESKQDYSSAERYYLNREGLAKKADQMNLVGVSDDDVLKYNEAVKTGGKAQLKKDMIASGRSAAENFTAYHIMVDGGSWKKEGNVITHETSTGKKTTYKDHAGIIYKVGDDGEETVYQDWRSEEWLNLSTENRSKWYKINGAVEIGLKKEKAEEIYKTISEEKGTGKKERLKAYLDGLGLTKKQYEYCWTEIAKYN